MKNTKNTKDVWLIILLGTLRKAKRVKIQNGNLRFNQSSSNSITIPKKSKCLLPKAIVFFKSPSLVDPSSSSGNKTFHTRLISDEQHNLTVALPLHGHLKLRHFKRLFKRQLQPLSSVQSSFAEPLELENLNSSPLALYQVALRQLHSLR